MSTQKPLYQRTFLAILICIVLFLIVEAVPHLVLGVNADDPRPALIRLALNIPLWFVVVPFVLRLPNGGGPFQDYLTSIGLKSHFPLWSAVLLALLAYATWAGSQLLVVRAFGWFGGIDHPSYLAGWLRGFDSGIFEEICVRGVILAILLKRLKEWPAILISAALFGLGHLIRILLGSPVPYELIVLSYTFLGGIFWAYIVVNTSSLIPAIVLHILIDTTGFILVPGEGSIVGIDTMFLIRRLVAAVAVLLVCMVIIPLLRRGGEDPHRDSLRTEEPGEAAGWRTG